MPARTKPDSPAAPGEPASAAAAAKRPGTASRSRPPAHPMPLKSLSEALGVRETVALGAVDTERMTRSFHLLVGTVERAKAAATGLEHRSYGTDLWHNSPHSVSAFVEEAILAACTYYENLLNDGQEFPRTGRLSPGPSEEGAARGARKRAAAREARKP